MADPTTPTPVPDDAVRRAARRLSARWLAAAALVFVAGACDRIETAVEDALGAPSSPHEAYQVSLERAGLEGTALVNRWRAAAAEALREPLEIDPPFREVSFFPAEEPTATAYVVSLERGQAMRATVDVQAADSIGVFLDVFHRDSLGRLSRVASADARARYIEFAPPDGGTFVLRVQPELLHPVRVTLSVLRAATLAFPVDGGGARDIGSRFGAPREGGRRSHHGVDIFAPRGTPVLAAADGRVSRVQETPLGGRVVWLRDAGRRHSLYYAHLDRQLVEDGQRVRAGDTLGLVGNSGNARTTPPHLHFGIYARRRGPVNPWSYIVPPPTGLPEVRADSTRLGEWVRLRSEARLAAPAPGGPGDQALPRHTVVRVVSAFDGRLRVRLPDGRLVAVEAPGLEAIDEPIERLTVAAGERLLAGPHGRALTAGLVEEEASLPVVGRFGDYRLVRPDSGTRGWVLLSSTSVPAVSAP